MNSLLLDANVIIDANKLGFWDNLIIKNKIYVASTVLRNEVRYYIGPRGQRKDIHLLDLARRGHVIELALPPSHKISSEGKGHI